MMATPITPLRKLRETRITLITQGDDEYLLLQMVTAMVMGLREFLRPYGASCGLRYEQLRAFKSGIACLGHVGEGIHVHIDFDHGRLDDGDYFADVCEDFEKPRNQLEVRRR
jgi:hypothetical protein